MPRRSNSLPSRFPVGTKFVIEGRPAANGQMQVFKRYIEFPDGTFFRLPARPDKRRPAQVARRLRRARPAATEPGPQPGGRP